jgi:hypothetical protein
MNVTIEKQEDGTYIAYNTDGEKTTVIGTGETVGAAKSDFMESMSAVRKVYERNGMEVPVELNGDVRFKFDLASLRLV